MREAFGALAALGLIDVTNGRRAKAGAIDGSVMGASLDHAVVMEQIRVAEVWDVRRTMEVRIAMLAAERRTEEQAVRIMALMQAIADAAANKLFAQIVRSFAPLMETAVSQAWRTRTAAEQWQAMIDRHLDLARTIQLGDPAADGAAMEAHFDASVGQELHAKDAQRAGA